MAEVADTISYSCVAYGTVVLAEGYYVSSHPPYAHIARKILFRVSLADSKKTFQVKEFVTLTFVINATIV